MKSKPQKKSYVKTSTNHDISTRFWGRSSMQWLQNHWHTDMSWYMRYDRCWVFGKLFCKFTACRMFCQWTQPECHHDLCFAPFKIAHTNSKPERCFADMENIKNMQNRRASDWNIQSPRLWSCTAWYSSCSMIQFCILWHRQSMRGHTPYPGPCHALPSQIWHWAARVAACCSLIMILGQAFLQCKARDSGD